MTWIYQLGSIKETFMKQALSHGSRRLDPEFGEKPIRFS